MSQLAPGRKGVAAVAEELRRSKGWHLEECLGRGGFGEVYRARVGNLYRAVRMSLDPIHGKNAAQQEHDILKQLADLQLLSHPRLVSLVDYDIVLGYMVTVWELADEPIRDLNRLLQWYRQHGHAGIPRNVLLRHVWGLAEAIDFLNGRGLYHRDVKPENCLLFQGEVKLADFGLSRFATISQTHLSGAGFGSCGYAPPETLQGKHSPTCDVYALAAMFAYLATGRHPFGLGTDRSVNPLAILERQSKEQWDLTGLTQRESACVSAALQADPAKRFSAGARAWVRSLSQEKPLTSASRSVVGVPRDLGSQGVASPSLAKIPSTGLGPVNVYSATEAGRPTVLPQQLAPAPTSGVATFWYIQRGNTCYGPYNLDQLRSLVREGRLYPLDTILDQNRQVVGHAGLLPWLFPGASPSQPIPAVVPAVEVVPSRVAMPVVEVAAAPVAAPVPSAVPQPPQYAEPVQSPAEPRPREFEDFVSKKIAAGLLGILLGGLGIHKFFLGLHQAGVIMLVLSLAGGVVTCGMAAMVMMVIGIVEGIIYLTKTDKQFYEDYCLRKKEWF
ncbi:MAG: protein kinase [Gemmatales bacterium]|nr:protein kinase [Gemmatales bacterium]